MIKQTHRFINVDTVIWSSGGVLLITGTLILIFAFKLPDEPDSVISPASNRFLAIYEPSGVAQLSDGRLIAVEDEAQNRCIC